MQIPPCPHPQCPNTTEEWRTVKGYESHYEVSNCGRVRSLDRYVRSKNNSRMLKRGHILVPEVSKPGKSGTYRGAGYLRVLLTINKVQKHASVPHLVLEAFAGQRPSPQHQANHLSGDKGDNHASNLEWATPSENQLHAFHVIKTGAVNCRPMHGPRNGIAKDLDTDYIRTLRAQGFSQQRIADIVGVNQTTISSVLRGQHWKDRDISTK